MPCGLRLDARGLLHHVMGRGLERHAICRDKGDRIEGRSRLTAGAPRTPSRPGLGPRPPAGDAAAQRGREVATRAGRAHRFERKLTKLETSPTPPTRHPNATTEWPQAARVGASCGTDPRRTTDTGAVGSSPC